MSNISSFRVYYEDTDKGGVVYYANYLKFAERARTELLRDAGINQSKLTQTDNILFVVRHAEMDLINSAKLDDMLNIHTKIEKISGPSIKMNQNITCDNNQLVKIKVHIACVNTSMKPVRIPSALITLLEKKQ